MKLKHSLMALFMALPLLASAPAALAATVTVALDPIEVDAGNKESLRRGANTFVNYCLSCHSAQYMRYERMALDLDISIDDLSENMMFTTDKPGDLMKTALSEEDARNWFGIAPPDLTLVSRVRKNNWLYTYLRAFYADETTAHGWNNTVFENAAMSHVLYQMQGTQTLVGHLEDGDEPRPNQTVVGDAIFELQSEGSHTSAEFDAAMYDLVNFLSYLAEPAQLKRRAIGPWVMAWLVVLFIVSYLLKKEYWRDMH